jgi:hypothetical protein
MKKIYIFILFTLAFVQACSYAPLQWYSNRSIIHKDYEIIGYGDGKTQAQAIRKARADICGQIKAKINDSFVSETVIANGTFSEIKTRKLKSYTEAVLTDTEIIASDFQHNSYFAAARFIKLPLKERVLLKLEKRLCAEQQREHPYLKHVYLYDFLREKLNCPINFEVKRISNVWAVFAQNRSVTLRKNEFKNFLSLVKSPNIKLVADKSVLKEKDTYFITVSANKNGFLSLFNINEKGQVFKLFANRRIRPDLLVKYPDSRRYEGIQAFISSEADEGADCYLAVFDKEKADFDFYQDMSVLNSHEGYDFERLMRDVENMEIASIVVRALK